MNRTKTVIDPEHSSATYWKDLWAYRGLFRFLAWRDLLVRYKQTVIGVAWAVIRPLLTIVVFSFLARLMSTNPSAAPVSLMVTAAALPWGLFSQILNDSSNSLISNSNLITKVYFPRLIVPLSTVIACLVDFLIGLVILVALMIYYGQVPSSNLVFFPLFILLSMVSSLGAGIFLASLNVKYRDFRYIVPVIIQLGIFVCPIMIKSSLVLENADVPQFVKTLYQMNPMVAVIDGFRWCLFGGKDYPLNWTTIQLGSVTTIFFLILGIWYFRRTEKNFADII
jgi:lipopolysaccharide transport system permease protein